MTVEAEDHNSDNEVKIRIATYVFITFAIALSTALIIMFLYDINLFMIGLCVYIFMYSVFMLIYIIQRKYKKDARHTIAISTTIYNMILMVASFALVMIFYKRPRQYQPQTVSYRAFRY